MKRWVLPVVVAVVASVILVPVFVELSNGPGEGLIPFRTYADLFGYLDHTLGRSVPNGLLRSNPGGDLVAGPAAPVASPAPGGDYSGTNVQVAGIDELDTVKTDGSYLYLAGSQDVAIVRAVPAPDLSVVARVPAAVATDMAENTSAWVSGLFLVGSHLVVVSSSGPFCGWGFGASPPVLVGIGPASDVCLAGVGGQTYVSVYGIGDPGHPVLESSIALSGTPLTGRLIPPYVYLVMSEPIVRLDKTYALPSTCTKAGCAALAPQAIYYDPTALEASSFTNLLALDANTGSRSVMSIVTGYTSTVYMSFQALYLTYAKWSGTALPMPAVPVPGGVASSVTTTWTTIHKIQVNGTAMEAVARADVPGTLLNQYSMDESGGYLRVFTTATHVTNDTWVRDNNLYVLDGSLATVGSLTGIAPGESVFAARFLGDRAYLVTFQQIDPLFVIDLSNPTSPSILGALNLTGFSDYLYPLDANHLLGIGKDTTNATGGEFSWQDGLKIALFDVANVTHPVEMSKLVLGERGTDSDVLRDGKAFLPIPSRGLVVLPVSLAIVNTSQYGSPIPPWAWGDTVWQGVYVLSANVTGGLTVVGRITHELVDPNPGAGVYLNASLEIHRALYIGDDLYTISPTTVMVNALSDLSPVASVVYESS